MITPSSTVRFLKVPFSPTQNNVLKFSDTASQTSYMLTKVVYTLSNCTYQRVGDGEFLKVAKNIDSLYNCNYVMFQNANFSNKWFYAFIDRIEYVNPQVTNVYLRMDSYQSFQFDFTLEKSFIERQTFALDSYNTLADTPSAGELKSVFEYEKTLSGNFFILFNADPTIEDSSLSGCNYPTIGGYSIPCYMAYFNTASAMSEVVQAVANKGRADRIQDCYFAPTMFNEANFQVQQMDRGDLAITPTFIKLVKTIDYMYLNEVFDINIGYTPIFKKELSYPYAKLEIVDKITGKYIELDLSKFYNPMNPQFKIIYNFTSSVEYKVIPLDYNGIQYSIENALVVQPNTDMPIFNNSYSKYLKDNQTSNMISGLMSLSSFAGSIESGNIAGGVSSFGSIASTINADNVARKQPNQVSGIKGDGMEYVNFAPSIFFRLKVMDTNHMNIARNFWTSYGYPVRKVTSHVTTDNDFNFVKTVGSNIVADTIPSEYQKDLEQIFDKGVTIWNRNYLQYTLS